MSGKLDPTTWKGDPLWIVSEIEISEFYQMVYAQIKIHPREWDA